MFKLKEYSVHANPLPMKNAVALLDILDCMSFVRTALRGGCLVAGVVPHGQSLSVVQLSAGPDSRPHTSLSLYLSVCRTW